MTQKWQVESFGRDCMGNITGYRVVHYGPRGHFEVAGQFVGNLYESGSFESAEARARQMCAAMNAAT